MLEARCTSLAALFIFSCGEAGTPTFQPESCKEAQSQALVIEGAPSYEHWRAQTARQVQDGSWVFEGDILIASEDQLHGMYLQQFGAPADTSDFSFRSAVDCDGNIDNTWDVSEKLDLTYCFGDFLTPGVESAVRAQLERSTLVWERAADVNFIHVPISKSQCNCIFVKDEELNPEACLLEGRSTAARIRVRELVEADCGSNCPPASASLPNSATFGVQEIRFHKDDIEEVGRHALHELGHTLGFRHEHLRWNQTSQDCIDNVVWRGVTDRDPDSIMGYGPCLGTSGFFSPDFVSSLDRVGLSYLYNIPRTEAPSFSTPGVDDILWYQPKTGTYFLWRALAQPVKGAPIEFVDKEEFCAVGMSNGFCTGDLLNITKPIPAALTTAHLTDIIAYGPEGASDAVLFHTASGALDSGPAVITDTFDLPLAGRFVEKDATEEVWWVRPGENTDHLGDLTQTYTTLNADFGDGFGTDRWFLPNVGLWAQRGSRRPNSQILWLRERDKQFLLSFQSADGFEMQQEPVTPACLFFENVRQPIALRGDFDDDDFMEIFWVSLSNGQHVFWRDTARMWSMKQTPNCNEQTIAEVMSTDDPNPLFDVDLASVKPFVGDFDGDAVTTFSGTPRTMRLT